MVSGVWRGDHKITKKKRKKEWLTGLSSDSNHGREVRRGRKKYLSVTISSGVAPLCFALLCIASNADCHSACSSSPPPPLLRLRPFKGPFIMISRKGKQAGREAVFNRPVVSTAALCVHSDTLLQKYASDGQLKLKCREHSSERAWERPVFTKGLSEDEE